jgi:hypothetical protein
MFQDNDQVNVIIDHRISVALVMLLTRNFRTMIAA